MRRRTLGERPRSRRVAPNERGEIPRSGGPALLAELAAAVLFSIALRARAGASRRALRAFARGAVQQIAGQAPSAARPGRARPARG
jgi:hypothetical protein